MHSKPAQAGHVAKKRRHVTGRTARSPVLIGALLPISKIQDAGPSHGWSPAANLPYFAKLPRCTRQSVAVQVQEFGVTPKASLGSARTALFTEGMSTIGISGRRGVEELSS